MKRRRRRRRMGNIQAPLKDGVNNDLMPLAGDRYLYSLENAAARTYYAYYDYGTP